MTVIVTDAGFGPDTFEGKFLGTEALPATDPAQALDLDPDAVPAEVWPRLGATALIRVAFPSFADGRGFSVARGLRRLGYTGRLRATGHVIADQYAMARRSGFDEVEIDAELAARQPVAQWLERADWQSLDYRARLTAAA